MAIRDIPEEDSNGCRATSTRVSSSRAIKGHQGPSRAITCRATSAVCTARVSGEHQSACDKEDGAVVSTGLRLPMGSRLATYLCRDERPNGRSLQRRRHVGRASECRPNRVL